MSIRSGRSPRLHAWIWFAVFSVLIVAQPISSSSLPEDIKTLLVYAEVLLLSVALVLIGVRRFRDMGASPWWAIPAAIPVIQLLPLVPMLFVASKASDAASEPAGRSPGASARAVASGR